MAKSSPAFLTQPSSALPPKITSIRTLAESPGLTTIPASHTFPQNPHDQVVSDIEEPVPVIDYSLLVSTNPDQRSKIIHELGKACQEWGFFKVINHGVPERLMNSMIDVCKEFFDLPEEEKNKYEGKHVLDPIRCGTSFNTSVEKFFSWRDFLKIFVHPIFHSPTKPVHFSENLLEYSKAVREVARRLVEGISESLGLEANYIHKALNMEKGVQISILNYYPACTQPELAMGLPSHSDHGLLTLLIENGVSGLQVQHKGKWVSLNTISNCFLVNTADHLEILSNGKYKSVVHRAVVNNRETRISIAMAHGPSLDSVVCPAPELLEDNGNHEAAAYRGMKYVQFLESQQSNKLQGKSILDTIRI
ncbi:2-oxoglutarate-dependent dioxygenase 19-like [Euphorbia lathyris]|uniref:2-oxoglutarate-dependent dioxygenase 19-like n=1 Tax=Euphorbia lathyris TaxID=212925 RepID=UPI003313D79A